MTRNILLIDDEKDFTELTGTLLDFHSLGVTTINDPVAALDALNKNRFDLVVTDLMMPQLNGFQIIEKIRAQDDYKTVPLIVLTAKPLTDEERKFLLKNDVHFLMKPFEPLGLVEQIRQLLGDG